MKSINTKISLWIILIIATMIFFIKYLFSQQEIISLSFIIDCLSDSVFIIGILAFLFNKYLWKLKIFQNWLVLIPDLNGIWEGTICSNWINPKTGEKIEPIKTKLSIVQSLIHISCVLTTGEMRSTSLSEFFQINKNKQILELSYIYISEPNMSVRHRSPIHHGAIIFNINKLDNGNIELFGNYWTERTTTGIIKLKRINKN